MLPSSFWPSTAHHPFREEGFHLQRCFSMQPILGLYSRFCRMFVVSPSLGRYFLRVSGVRSTSAFLAFPHVFALKATHYLLTKLPSKTRRRTRLSVAKCSVSKSSRSSRALRAKLLLIVRVMAERDREAGAKLRCKRDQVACSTQETSCARIGEHNHRRHETTTTTTPPSSHEVLVRNKKESSFAPLLTCVFKHLSA